MGAAGGRARRVVALMLHLLSIAHDYGLLAQIDRHHSKRK